MNEEMTRLVARLREWRRAYGGTAETPDARRALQECLCGDEASFRLALRAVKAMSYEEMSRLQSQDHQLNTPDGVDVDYAAQLVNAVCGPDSDLVLTDIDDYVNMLKRVVEYAQYV